MKHSCGKNFRCILSKEAVTTDSSALSTDMKPSLAGGGKYGRSLNVDVHFPEAFVPVPAGMFGFFFTKGPVTCFEDAKAADTAKFGRFHRGMLERGVYLAPSAYEVISVLQCEDLHPSTQTLYCEA
jgi:hypothetical protein